MKKIVEFLECHNVVAFFELNGGGEGLKMKENKDSWRDEGTLTFSPANLISKQHQHCPIFPHHHDRFQKENTQKNSNKFL